MSVIKIDRNTVLFSRFNINSRDFAPFFGCCFSSRYALINKFKGETFVFNE